jgi:hypothetical protein
MYRATWHDGAPIAPCITPGTYSVDVYYSTRSNDISLQVLDDNGVVLHRKDGVGGGNSCNTIVRDR